MSNTKCLYISNILSGCTTLVIYFIRLFILAKGANDGGVNVESAALLMTYLFTSFVLDLIQTGFAMKESCHVMFFLHILEYAPAGLGGYVLYNQYINTSDPEKVYWTESADAMRAMYGLLISGFISLIIKTCTLIPMYIHYVKDKKNALKVFWRLIRGISTDESDNGADEVKSDLNV